VKNVDVKLIKKLYLSGKSLREIGEKVNISHVSVSTILKSNNVKLRTRSKARRLALLNGKFENKKYRYFNEKIFDKWNRTSAYLIGLLLTDGTVTKRIGPTGLTQDSRFSLSLIDEGHIKKVEKALGGSLYTRITTKNIKSQYSIQVYSKHAVDRLIQIGITPNKSLSVKWPEVPEELEHHFIRGVFDGDGSVFLDRRSNRLRVSFTSGSYDFISTLRSRLIERNITTSRLYQEQRKVNIVYMIRITKYDAISTFYKYIYGGLGAKDIYLDRKHNKFKEFSKC